MDMEQKHSQMSLLFLLRKQLGRILTEETAPAKLAETHKMFSPFLTVVYILATPLLGKQFLLLILGKRVYKQSGEPP